MNKSTHFFGQPVYGQLIKSLDRAKIVELSRKHGGEKYVKSFDGYVRLRTMLFAVIMRFDSLREIEAAFNISGARQRVVWCGAISGSWHAKESMQSLLSLTDFIHSRDFNADFLSSQIPGKISSFHERVA